MGVTGSAVDLVHASMCSLRWLVMFRALHVLTQLIQLTRAALWTACHALGMLGLICCTRCRQAAHWPDKQAMGSHSLVPWPVAEDSGKSFGNHSVCQTCVCFACYASNLLYIVSKDSHHLLLCMFVMAWLYGSPQSLVVSAA